MPKQKLHRWRISRIRGTPAEFIGPRLDQFWAAVKEIAKERGVALKDIVGSIKAERRKGNLSSAIRVFVVEHYGASSPSSPTPRTP
jgi:predicted DNA-binding ribbon-helix-helix protein